MLTILNDPAGVTGRQRHPWDYAATLHENIARHLRSGAGCTVLINGLEIDPLTDPRMDRPPSALDFVSVIRRPEGSGILSFGIFGSVAVNAIMRALLPSVPGNVSRKDSPNNALTGQTNVARAYQAIPDVYGLRRCWPDMIQPSTIEYVDHIKYVTEWLCVSRGVGTLSAVKFAETPILDIEGASYEIFAPAGGGAYPENGATTLHDVIETFASDEVDGQELEYAEPFPAINATGSMSAVAGSGVFTVTIPDGAHLDQLKGLSGTGSALVVVGGGEAAGESAPPPTYASGTFPLQSFSVAAGSCAMTFAGETGDVNVSGQPVRIVPDAASRTTLGPFTLPVSCPRIRWNTVFLRGLRGTANVRAEWWRVDGGGAEIADTRQHQDFNYSADTYDQRFFTTEVIPAGGEGVYRAQFTRMNPQQRDDGTDVAKLEELYAVRHYPTKVLPGVTVIRVTTKATTEATGYRDRKFNLMFARHVRQLDSDTLGASRNFARAMAHIWTLAGNDIAQLDTDALQAINAEHGEGSPLLRFDGSLDDEDMSLGERLQAVANAARCIVWRDGQRWTVTRDQARDYPEVQLDYRNLAAGGESAISYAAHLPASHDGVELEYVDEASQSKKAYIRLNIGSGAPVEGVSGNSKKIKLLGCATQAQAMNRAQLEARRLLYQRTSVSDTALSDGGSLGLGSLVRWIDPNDFAGDDGLQAGEVLAIDGDLIRTSEPVDWKGETYGRILFTGADGRHLGPPALCYPAGEDIQLASVPEGIYVADADRQCGSRYAFAVGLTESEIEAAGLFTVTEIKPDASGNISLGLAEYDSRIYEAD